MTEPENKILGMVAEGTISPEEGDQLLRALRPERAFKFEWLWNPFPSIQPGHALIVGLFVLIASLSLSGFRMRFDGAIDLHLVPYGVTWLMAVTDQVVAWPLTALVLWLAARVAGSRGRLLDFFVHLGLARAPLLVAAGITIVVLGDASRLDVSRLGEGQGEALALVLALVLVPCLMWFFVFLVQGFRDASGLAGARLGYAFTAGVLTAELLSKLVLGVVL